MLIDIFKWDDLIDKNRGYCFDFHLCAGRKQSCHVVLALVCFLFPRVVGVVFSFSHHEVAGIVASEFNQVISHI